MKNLLLSVLSVMTLSSAALAAQPVSESSVSHVEDKTSCILGFADNLDAQLVLTATPDAFSIFTPSSTGHTIEIVYEKTAIALFMAPIEAPILECSSETANIVVWDRIALVNGQYFSIENATSIHGD